MTVHRVVRLAAAGLGAALVAGALVAVTAAAAGVKGVGAAAASPKPASKPATAYCDNFGAHLATDLGKTPDQVKKAYADAAAQTLDDAVRSGDLTQAQADQAKKKLAAESPCPPGLAGIGHPAPVNKGGDNEFGDAEAKALGISSSELVTDLKKGMTLHQIADSKGISEAQFRAAYAANVRSQLDPAVASGKLTQKQEDDIVNRAQTGPLPLWDHAAGTGSQPGDKTKTAPPPA